MHGGDLMSTSLVQILIDTQLRDNANTLFDSLGLDMTTAVKIFFKKCLAEGGIPFEVKTNCNFYGSIIFSVWPGTQTSAFGDLKIA